MQKLMLTIGFLVLSISMLVAQGNPSAQQPANQPVQTVTTTTTAPAAQSAPEQNSPVAPANSTVPDQTTNPGVKPSDVQTTPPVTEQRVVVTPSQTLPTPAPSAGASNATAGNQAGASSAPMNQGGNAAPNTTAQPAAPTTPQAVEQSPSTMPNAARVAPSSTNSGSAVVTTQSATTPRISSVRPDSGLATADSAWATPADSESLAEASVRAKQAMATQHPRVFTNAEVARDRQAAGLPPQEPVADQSTMPASDVVADQPAMGQQNNMVNGRRRVPSPFRPKPVSPDQTQPQ